MFKPFPSYNPENFTKMNPLSKSLSEGRDRRKIAQVDTTNHVYKILPCEHTYSLEHLEDDFGDIAMEEYQDIQEMFENPLPPRKLSNRLLKIQEYRKKKREKKEAEEKAREEAFLAAYRAAAAAEYRARYGYAKEEVGAKRLYEQVIPEVDEESLEEGTSAPKRPRNE